MPTLSARRHSQRSQIWRVLRITRSVESRLAGVTEAIEVTVVINMEFLDDGKLLFEHGKKFD